MSWTTPGASPFRHRLETASRDLLVRLQRMPRWVLIAVAIMLTLGGALLPGWAGAACLLLIAVFLGWLLFLAWPQLTGGQRALRLAMGAVVVAAAVVRILEV